MSFNLQAQRLQRLFSSQELKNTNLHLVAISNLQNHERRVIRWWCKKYRTPEKPLGDHTMEELLVEYLEDYYENNPKEIQKLLNSIIAETSEWDGSVSADYESSMQKRLSKIKKVDLSKWQSDEELSPEQEEDIIASLGRNLKKSSQDEFEEEFQ